MTVPKAENQEQYIYYVYTAREQITVVSMLWYGYLSCIFSMVGITKVGKNPRSRKDVVTSGTISGLLSGLSTTN